MVCRGSARPSRVKAEQGPLRPQTACASDQDEAPGVVPFGFESRTTIVDRMWFNRTICRPTPRRGIPWVIS